MIIIGVSALVLALLSGCVTPSAPASSASQAPAMASVRIAYLPLISNGPLFIAKDEGYFSRQGIDAELEKFQSSATALPALVNGDIAVSGGQLTPGLVNVVAQGVHVRITADKGRNVPGYCNTTALVVRRDLMENGTVKKLSDLKGMKIGATTDQSYSLFRALALGNLTTMDVETLNMAGEANVIALENRAIDAGILQEPYLTEAVNRGRAVVFIGGGDFVPNHVTPLYYGPAFLDSNPDLGRRFMVAYLQGVRQYNEGKTDRNIQILSNYTHLDRDVLERSCWAQVSPNGTVPREPVRDYVDWMYANKQITQKPDIDTLLDMSFVDYAKGVLGNTSGSG